MVRMIQIIISKESSNRRTYICKPHFGGALLCLSSCNLTHYLYIEKRIFAEIWIDGKNYISLHHDSKNHIISFINQV